MKCKDLFSLKIILKTEGCRRLQFCIARKGLVLFISSTNFCFIRLISAVISVLVSLYNESVSGTFRNANKGSFTFIIVYGLSFFT